MTIKIYGKDFSPACRAVFLVLEELELPYEKIPIELLKGDQLKPEYLKINPQHTIPTLVDGAFSIWDSHAILPYLSAKYGKSDSLYPSDLEKRAVVDQRLHYDSSVLSKHLHEVVVSALFKGKSTISEQETTDITQAYELLNTFLVGLKWMAGNAMTIADIGIAAHVSTFEHWVLIDDNKYPNLVIWLSKMKKLPYYQRVNGAGAKALGDLFKTKTL